MRESPCPSMVSKGESESRVERGYGEGDIGAGAETRGVAGRGWSLWQRAPLGAALRVLERTKGGGRKGEGGVRGDAWPSVSQRRKYVDSRRYNSMPCVRRTPASTVIRAGRLWRSRRVYQSPEKVQPQTEGLGSAGFRRPPAVKRHAVTDAGLRPRVGHLEKSGPRRC